VPELPDVEGFRRYFNRHAAGKRMREVEVPAPAIVRNTSGAALARALRGRRLAKSERRGKWLLAPTGEPLLLFHFGMTGGFRWNDERHRHDRLVLHFADGALAYRNMRMLGGVWLVAGKAGAEGVTGPLGPDAATVDREGLAHLLERRRGGLKAALMDQRLIAGIGNELSDEILWQARLAPTRRVPDLSERETGALHRASRKVLVESMRRGRIPRHPRWITSQRRARQPRCPRCRGAVRRDRIAGRTAYWCPHCQR
jgi:formamidopyrimidine-DNA glycosylase